MAKRSSIAAPWEDEDPWWTCKDGRQLRLSQMEIGHLRNTIAKVVHDNGKFRPQYIGPLLAELKRRMDRGEA